MEDGSLTPIERSKLTEAQLQLWDMRYSQDPPLALAEVAERIGVNLSRAKLLHSQALHSLGRAPEEGEGPSSLTRTDPDRAAAVMAEATNPMVESLVAIGRSCGVSANTASRYAKLMDGKFLELKRKGSEILTKEFEDAFGATSWRLLASLTDEDIKKMPGYQRVIAACAAVDKRELLRNKPTETVGTVERRALELLVPLLLREARRRGLEPDTDPETIDVTISPGLLADGTPNLGADRKRR